MFDEEEFKEAIGRGAMVQMDAVSPEMVEATMEFADQLLAYFYALKRADYEDATALSTILGFSGGLLAQVMTNGDSG